MSKTAYHRPTWRRKYRAILFLLLLSLLPTLSARAQFYFGKNKVQYTRFDWQVMTTEHFRIYFYAEESEIAQVAARLAEDSYRQLAIKFNHEVLKTIPLVIYSSPSYFSQTNIIPGLLPEGVAGFTEFMKGRVVLPFHGSYHDFDHVLRHELVHVFTISKLKHVLKKRTRIKTSPPPLWFTEGLAEFWSKDWDADADMIVKDMVISGRLFTIPRLYQIRGSYFMYKLGESICHFIHDHYGPEKLQMLLENWYKGRNFNEVVKVTLGDDLNELSRKWEYSLKKRYFPQLSELGLPAMESKHVTSDGYSVKGVPIMWDDGTGRKEWIVFKANRLGYAGIYMKPATGNGRSIKTLLKGERSSEFESLYLLRSGIDANDSGIVVFSSKSKDRDVIYIYDLSSQSVTQRFEFDNLIATRSPRLSPDGVHVVFSGVRTDGFSNLYLLDLISGEYEELTNDIYFDVDPAFSPDGSAIIYSSDRSGEGKSGALNLFEFDLDDGSIRQITFGHYRDLTPEWSERGIFFSSNRGGTYNIFLLDSAGQLTRQSTYVTGVFDPRLSSDGNNLTYTGYEGMAFQIYRMELKSEPEIIERPLAKKSQLWSPQRIDRKFSKTSIKYDTDYSFDIAQSAVGYDPVYGSIGGFQAALSDVLGNHVFYLLLTNTAETRDELLQSFNFGLTYLNRERRLNWGLGAFHLYDEYFNDAEGFFTERQAGMLNVISYPFSKFHRMDFTTVLRYSKRDRLFGQGVREALLMTNYVSWVFDNSLWDISGPIEGRRYNLSFGLTTAINKMSNFNRQMSVDVRHYLRLGRYSALANRMFGFSSTGSEPQRIYFGGSWSFRGFSRRAFYVRKVAFSSTELRFPLIDNLLIGFPFGGLGFNAIRGALFYDMGAVGEEELGELLWSAGAGFRVALGGVAQFRFDFARTKHNPSTDFDFFFGWNF